jgi:hypothetical protein
VADLEDLTTGMRRVTEARDRGRFHDAKSLTPALAGQQRFRWRPVMAPAPD